MYGAYKALSIINTVKAIFKGNILKRLVNLFIGRHIVRRLWWR